MSDATVTRAQRELLRDPIFKGATRPAMMFGVPFVPCVVVVGTHVIGGIWSMIGTPLLALLCLFSLVFVLFSMRAITSKDDQRLHQWTLRIGLWLRQSNRKFWGASSYSAVRHRKQWRV